MLAQKVGDLVCALVEIPVRKLALPAHNGDGIGTAVGLRLEQLMHADRRKFRAGVVPPVKQSLAFGFVQTRIRPGAIQSDHAMISFKISFVPAKIRSTRLSDHIRAMAYSIM